MKYFGEVFVGWKSLVQSAKLNGLPGDILTLAEDAPTRFHHTKLLWEAADALVRMRRFKAARSVLEELLLINPKHRRAQAQLDEVLAGWREASSKKVKGSEPRGGKVIVFSGHMIDLPGRGEERFPQSKEPAVRAAIERQLDAWKVCAKDLAICGGARGGDILFAEACLARGAEVWLFLPLAEPEFLEESVRGVNEGDWEERFYALRGHERVKVFSQPERLKSPPKGTSAFARNNVWMINTARVEADDPANLYALLVWDERPTGDGAGGTSDFASRVRRLGGRLAKPINPTQL